MEENRKLQDLLAAKSVHIEPRVRCKLFALPRSTKVFVGLTANHIQDSDQTFDSDVQRPPDELEKLKMQVIFSKY